MLILAFKAISMMITIMVATIPVMVLIPDSMMVADPRVMEEIIINLTLIVDHPVSHQMDLHPVTAVDQHLMVVLAIMMRFTVVVVVVDQMQIVVQTIIEVRQLKYPDRIISKIHVVQYLKITKVMMMNKILLNKQPVKMILVKHLSAVYR